MKILVLPLTGRTPAEREWSAGLKRARSAAWAQMVVVTETGTVCSAVPSVSSRGMCVCTEACSITVSMGKPKNNINDCIVIMVDDCSCYRTCSYMRHFCRFEVLKASKHRHRSICQSQLPTYLTQHSTLLFVILLLHQNNTKTSS